MEFKVPHDYIKRAGLRWFLLHPGFAKDREKEKGSEKEKKREKTKTKKITEKKKGQERFAKIFGDQIGTLLPTSSGSQTPAWVTYPFFSQATEASV